MTADRLVTDYEYRGPKRGADRAVLLAHGAGADMHAENLVAFADACAARGVPSLCFNFPYKSAGKKAPDRAPVLLAAVDEAIAELAKRTKLGRDRIVLGGRSMGGRMCSMVAAEAAAADRPLGLMLLAYPLHAPGRPEKPRVEHLGSLRMPVLFVSGTRDTFGTPEELPAAAKLVKGKVSWHWIETGDHSFRPLKRETGRTQAEVVAEAAAAAVDWVTALR